MDIQNKFDAEASTKLAESYTSGIKMGVLLDNEPLTPLFFCKDYFQEFLLTSFYPDALCNGKSIYGYRCKGEPAVVKKDAIDFYFNVHRYSFSSSPINSGPINQDWTGPMMEGINELDVLAELPLTTFKITDGGVGMILTVNKGWIEKPALISLFLLISRLTLSYKKDIHGNILNFIERGFPYWENGGPSLTNSGFNKFIRTTLKTFPVSKQEFNGWDVYKEYNISRVHDCSGIYSVFTEQEPKKWKEVF